MVELIEMADGLTFSFNIHKKEQTFVIQHKEIHYKS
jgi:hypothetical protein